jgi:hypothetical protein
MTLRRVGLARPALSAMRRGQFAAYCRVLVVGGVVVSDVLVIGLDLATGLEVHAEDRKTLEWPKKGRCSFPPTHARDFSRYLAPVRALTWTGWSTISFNLPGSSPTWPVGGRAGRAGGPSGPWRRGLQSAWNGAPLRAVMRCLM